MPIRTTPTLVKEICEVDEEFVDDPAAPSILTPFIRVASGLVDAKCTTSGYADAWLTEIETWLAAHFYKILDPQLVRSEVSSLREVFQQEVGLSLDQTRYGQMAKVIDYKGNLAALDASIKKGKMKVGLDWVGTHPDEVE